MRKQLQLQSQVHADHLREILSMKDSEMQRMVDRAVSEHSEEETVKYKTQLAAVIGRLRGLDGALKREYTYVRNSFPVVYT